MVAAAWAAANDATLPAASASAIPIIIFSAPGVLPPSPENGCGLLMVPREDSNEKSPKKPGWPVLAPVPQKSESRSTPRLPARPNAVCGCRTSSLTPAGASGVPANDRSSSTQDSWRTAFHPFPTRPLGRGRTSLPTVRSAPGLRGWTGGVSSPQSERFSALGMAPQPRTEQRLIGVGQLMSRPISSGQLYVRTGCRRPSRQIRRTA